MARRPRPSGTLADTYEHLLGRSATQRLVAPFAEGVFGGSTDVLADTVVPRPVEGSLVLASLLRSVRRKEPESGPPATDGLLAVAGGMGRLVEVLSGRLEVAVGEPVVGLDRHPNGTIGVRTEQRALSADAVVVAAPPPATAGLVRDVAPPAATALAHVVCGSSAIIHVEVAPEHQERLAALGASGWLGAPEERPAVAAGSFVGLKWPHLGCPGRVRASVRREDLLAGGDDRLMRVALDEIEAVLGVPLLREGTRLHRWDRALPLRTPDAAAQVARARAALPGDVVLVGTAEGGSGVASALMSGRRGADRLGLSPKATDGRPSGWTSGQWAAHS
jgi:oxygen-dependent protoporphyrinogen oxidase